MLTVRVGNVTLHRGHVWKCESRGFVTRFATLYAAERARTYLIIIGNPKSRFCMGHEALGSILETMNGILHRNNDHDHGQEVFFFCIAFVGA